METAIRRRAERKRKYGVTDADFNSLMQKQDACCGICGTAFDDTPHIDHNHDTKKVRGLLCRPCNRGLGMFKDNKNLLRRAINYLHRTDRP